MTLKSCPNCGETKQIDFNDDGLGNDFWCGCLNCNMAGPSEASITEAEKAWNDLPRRDDSQNQYAMRIRVKIYDIPKHGKEEERFFDGYGWLIAIDNAPVIVRDCGQIEMISFKNIEVDNGSEA